MNLFKVSVTNPKKEVKYPYMSPLFVKGFSLDLADITILVGENGTGKSTLLEALALAVGFPLSGGRADHADIYNDISRVLKYHSKYATKTFAEEVKDEFFGEEYKPKNFVTDNIKLADNIELSWRVKSKKGMFLRAESFFTLINLPRYSASTKLSHGEGLLSVIESISDGGLYILDEPEAGLSPFKTLELLSQIIKKNQKYGAQFIISTHSPILMLVPNAKLYEITDSSLKVTSPKQTAHFSVTKRILNDPEEFIKRYFE